MPRVWRKHMDSRAGGSDSVHRYPDAGADAGADSVADCGTDGVADCGAERVPDGIADVRTDAGADCGTDSGPNSGAHASGLRHQRGRHHRLIVHLPTCGVHEDEYSGANLAAPWLWHVHRQC